MNSLILALLAAFALTAPRASALPPAYHTLQGQVVAVDPEHKRFTVRTVKTPSGLSLSWGPRTQFFRDSKLVASTSLKRGQRVTVRYRAPFFGPHLAGRIFVLSGEK